MHERQGDDLSVSLALFGIDAKTWLTFHLSSGRLRGVPGCPSGMVPTAFFMRGRLPRGLVRSHTEPNGNAAHTTTALVSFVAKSL